MNEELLDHTDNWLRYFREEAGWSQQDAADAAGVSKVFYNRVERGKQGKHLSPDKADRLAASLGDALEIEGLSASDLFPDNGMKSPREAARLYFDACRARDLQRLAEMDEDDPPPTVVPEDEYEHDMAKLDSGAHLEARDRYYSRQDPATYGTLEFFSPDGRLIREHPPTWFREAMQTARQEGRREGGRPRGKRTSKRRGSNSSSSSDDPGESEPPLAAATNGGQA